MAKYLLPIAALLSSYLSLLVQAQTALTGTVVTEDGRPVPAAELSRIWVLGTPDANGARAYGSVRSDPSGHFSLPLEQGDRPLDLLVYSTDRKEAAVVHAHAPIPSAPMTVVLKPATLVRVTADAPTLGIKLNSPRFLLQSQTGAQLGQLFENGVTFPLAEGRYQLSLSSADTVSTTKSLDVSSTKPVSEHFGLSLSAMAKRIGRQPPPLLGLIDAQNSSILAPRFDRPTLLYFWADWCQPCIAEGIPHLLAFAKDHHGERYQILAIHENGIPDISTIATFQRSLQHLEKSVWQQDLSFPFAFDSSGETTSAWGLSTFPTYALIDRKGTLQREADLEHLAKLIKK